MTRGTDSLHFFYDAQSRPAKVNFNGAMYTYAHNLQGDAVGILDNAGNLVVEYKYDAWGKLLGTTGTLKATLGKLNPFRYRSYVYDTETGLYYLCSRYYNAAFGRFISIDRVIGRLGKVRVENGYTYSISNPVNYYDPDGATAIDIPQTGTPADLFIFGAAILYSLVSYAVSSMAPKPVTAPQKAQSSEATITKAIGDIAGSFGSKKCVEAAEAVKEYLLQRGQHGAIIEIKYPTYPGFVISISLGGDPISENGRHVGIEYKDIVYCNIHPTGLPKDLWIADFDGVGVPEIFEYPF